MYSFGIKSKFKIYNKNGCFDDKLKNWWHANIWTRRNFGIKSPLETRWWFAICYILFLEILFIFVFTQIWRSIHLHHSFSHRKYEIFLFVVATSPLSHFKLNAYCVSNSNCDLLFRLRTDIPNILHYYYDIMMSIDRSFILFFCFDSFEWTEIIWVYIHENIYLNGSFCFPFSFQVLFITITGVYCRCTIHSVTLNHF